MLEGGNRGIQHGLFWRAAVGRRAQRDFVRAVTELLRLTSVRTAPLLTNIVNFMSLKEARPFGRQRDFPSHHLRSNRDRGYSEVAIFWWWCANTYIVS
jgi:hypothetical protein